MKSILFTLLAVMLLGLSSCSKSERISRTLNGKWKATMYEDQSIPEGTTLIYQFSRGKKGKGTGISSYVYSGFTVTTPFSYEIADEKMKYTTVDNNGVSTTAILNITKHKRKDMVFVNVSSGKTTKLEAQ